MEGFGTVHAAESHLIACYGIFQAEHAIREPLDVYISDNFVNVEHTFVDESVLDTYKFRSPYLGKRGISERTQRRFGVGYSHRKRAVTLPWRDEKGRLVTIKFRSVAGKRFWYDPPADRSALWYGLHAIQRNSRRVAIVEAEVDALSVWDVGVDCIAIGGNQPTKAQLAKLSGYLSDECTLIVFTDNDAGGDVAKRILTDAYVGRRDIRTVDWNGLDAKDANELTATQRKEAIEQATRVGIAVHI